MYARLIRTILITIMIAFCLLVPPMLIHAESIVNNRLHNKVQLKIEKLWSKIIKIKNISKMNFYKMSISNSGNVFVVANINEQSNLGGSHFVKVLAILYALDNHGNALWKQPFRTYVKCPLTFIPFSIIYCGAYVITNNKSSVIALVGSYKIHCLNENGRILFTKKFDTMLGIVKVVNNYVFIEVSNCILVFDKRGNIVWRVCGNIRSFGVCPNGSIVAVLFGNGKIDMYSIKKAELVRSISIPKNIILKGFLKGSCNVYVSPNTRYLAIACGYISSCSASSLKCSYITSVLVLSTLTGRIVLHYFRNITFTAFITIGGPPISASEFGILSNRWFIVKITLGPPRKSILIIFNLINRSVYELDFNHAVTLLHLYPYNNVLIVLQSGKAILLNLRNRIVLWRGNIPIGGKIVISPDGEYLAMARSSSLYHGIIVTEYRIKLIQSIVCDLDHNGMLDFGDVILLLKALVGAYHGNVSCDLNHNGKLDIGDVILLLEMIMGIS